MSLNITLDTVKSQAKALRQSLSDAGHSITHSQSLELMARQLGHRDWNTLHAKIGNAPPHWAVEQRVSGAYLGHRFAGKIIAVHAMAGGERYRLTIRFDTAIDVIKFDGMSSFRRQINATIGRDGRTIEHISDGTPHLQLDL